MLNNFEAIPKEIAMYPHWVVWRYEERGGDKPTKVPYDPKTGRMASVTDPLTWSNFDVAVAAASRYSGIGFVLTRQDPFAVIDLDDPQGDQPKIQRQIDIFKAFDSYSEKSPSGHGLHIVVKADVPAGRKRSAIELYSSERYITFTGNIFHNKPIMERQAITRILWDEMGGSNIAASGTDNPQIEDDTVIFDRASAATNGAKFKRLYEGDWQSTYSSQSEADFALIDILAFYSQNRLQITRMFHNSALGQREKAKRPDYLNYMLNKAFDHILPPIDILGLKELWDAHKAKQSGGTPTTQAAVAPSPESPQEQAVNEVIKLYQPPDRLTAECITSTQAISNFWQIRPIDVPHGMLGQIANFIYKAAPRPVPEIAICAAIGLLAGIVGRSYNVSGTGLNMYVLLAAPTGTGKEGISSGINKLMSVVAEKVPSADSVRGPAEIASGQALLRHLTQVNPCFVSLIGEFGLKMQHLANPKAGTSEIMLKRALLSLYHKSGSKDSLDPTIFADKNKDTVSVKSPSVSLIGETTPETLYKALDESMILDGLLPRFLTIEYTGDRPPLNEAHETYQADPELIRLLGELCQYSLWLQKEGVVNTVEQSHEARQFLRRVNELADDAINRSSAEVLRHLWNRAHLKTMKLAALVAVGRNSKSPCIALEDAQWAFNMVCTDVFGVIKRFESGLIGADTNEAEQEQAIINVAEEYCMADGEYAESYGIDPKMQAAYIIPRAYLSRRLTSRKCFKHPTMTFSRVLDGTLDSMMKNGLIAEVERRVMTISYGTTQKAYMLTRKSRPVKK